MSPPVASFEARDRNGNWPLRRLSKSVALAILAAWLTIGLVGCEKPNTQNVVFKPPELDPEAHSNAIRIQLITHGGAAQPWGNAFLARPALGIWPGRAPLPNHPIRIDGLESRANRKGFLSLDGLRTGFHDLELTATGSRRRLSLPVEKGRMTLCAMEALPDGRFIASHMVAEHGYLLIAPFRELRKLHEAVVAFVDALEGRAGDAAFADAISQDYADDAGRRDDLIRARRFSRHRGLKHPMQVRSVSARVGPGHGELNLVADVHGKRTLCRMQLEADPEAGSPWRLISVAGMNPLERAFQLSESD